MNFTGKRVFVTGATGFVGRHLVRRLCSLGAQVTALVRKSSDCSVLPPEVRMVTGDLASADFACGETGRALAASDCVVHCAALLFARDWQDYMRGNVLSARHLARAVAAHVKKPCRVLLVSSLAAAGPCAHAPGKGEEEPASPVSAYGWSKFLAEQAMGACLGGHSLVVIRPPIVYGPEDRALLPYFKLAAKGFVFSPGLRAVPMSFLFVDDLVNAMLLCLGESASGVYHIEDGRPSSMRGFGRLIALAAGRRALCIPLPQILVQTVAGVGNLVARCFSSFFPLTPDKALEGRQSGWLADGARIRRELGFTPGLSPEEGVARTLSAYQGEQGR
ncbi:NAD(P)-dependent oxidoreductase [Desulfovibrio sp. OttesenSCG-928-A18]|nr:NAD(P)-dependent oxidoreductase [Desulfovibrio sp. OttesenSCG-928-A18]